MIEHTRSNISEARMSRKTLSLLTAAALAAIGAPVTFAATVDGTVSAGEYGPSALALQGTYTNWGNNANELDGLYGSYTPGGGVGVALTGNLSNNGFTLAL
jgi:hypothetical protein